ncbi:Glutamate [NMDA] receptor subunit 1 [Chamberlinius hualienensis]
MAAIKRCFLYFLFFSHQTVYSSTVNPKIYHLGGVLSTNDNAVKFEQEITNLQSDVNMLPPGIKFYAATVLMNSNPIRTALSVCEYLIGTQVYAVVVSHPANSELSPAAVSYTCGFYHIPVIGISSRDSAFSDKNIHVSFLRTVPPYSHQADVWIEILNYFHYRRVLFIHSADADGIALLARFQTLAQNLSDEHEIKVDKIGEFIPGTSSVRTLLQDLKESHARVILLYASAEDAETIFRDAEELNMTGAGYAWLVTEQSLEASNIFNGALALQLVNATDEGAHIHDSVQILALALRQMYFSENITEAPKNCNSSGTTWETGKKFFNYVKQQKLLYGQTGNVEFDDNGDRRGAEYELINVYDGTQVVVGQYTHSKAKMKMELTVQDKQIVWPGNRTTPPPDCIIPSNLRIVTVVDKPFVWARKIENNEVCDVDRGEILCPKNASNATLNGPQDTIVNHCCWGYCIDLLKTLSIKMNFTYNLRLGKDGQYGTFEKVNGSDKKEWTGLMAELVNDRADMIVAPLTINQERAQAVEFSKPFKYQGITILEKRHSKSSTLVSFLQPFQETLWILVMVSVHIVALVLYLLDRFSPFGRFKLGNSDAMEEDALNLSSAIWFAWGVLLNSGIGEGTPRSFSARVLGMVWAGFAMIIVASYTANLAAFLVLERPETSLSGINDARLRNPMENFTYATVKGSSVDMYFRRQVELSNMYRTMEGNNYNTAEEAIAAVKIGKLKAFIWDSSRLEYEAAQDCELVTAGELFGRSGYGIALQKNSPWSDQVTLSILHFHESGFMEELDNKWILQTSAGDNCQQSEKAPATLGLRNMAGVFILVAAGIVGGIVLIIIEIVYKKQQIRKQKRMELARHAADKWRGVVEKRKTLRATMEAQRRLKANGVGEGGLQEKQDSLQVSFLLQGNVSDMKPMYSKPVFKAKPYIEYDDAVV